MNAHRPLSLFRPEVAEARQHRLAGEIILAQPVRAHVLTLLLVAIIVLVAAWIMLGTYTRSEIARGILVTDQPSAKVIAVRPGVITELMVRDGQLVRAGQRIASIQIEQGNELGGSAVGDSLTALDLQRSLAENQETLASDKAVAERARLRATLNGLARQRADVAAQIELQQQLVASTQATVDRLASIIEKGFVSRIEYDRRQQIVLTAKQQLAQLRQQSNASLAETARANAELLRVTADAGSEINGARTSAQSFTQQRAQALAQRAYVITAPVDGRVTALQAAIGRTVDASAPLMTIVPEGTKLHAEVYAPTRAIGFVKPGQEVRLLFDAFPYQRFGSFEGRVVRISRTVIDPRELAAPLKIEEAVYRIEVEPMRQSAAAFGQALPLQPGMTLSANLILERRSFSGWLLRPLNAVLRRNGG